MGDGFLLACLLTCPHASFLARKRHFFCQNNTPHHLFLNAKKNVFDRIILGNMLCNLPYRFLVGKYNFFLSRCLDNNSLYCTLDIVKVKAEVMGTIL